MYIQGDRWKKMEKKYLNNSLLFHWALRKSTSCTLLVYLLLISLLIKPGLT
jgi:hypothetical protein